MLSSNYIGFGYPTHGNVIDPRKLTSFAPFTKVIFY
jgi:hypothetical protein